MTHDKLSALKRARSLLSGAAVSVEHILAAETEASLLVRTEQQTGFILTEIDHAISQLEDARQAFAAEPKMGKAA